MKKIYQSLVIAFSMYSKIPMPQVNWEEENMRYALCFFPLIGAVIGLLEYLVFRLPLFLGLGVLFRSALLILVPLFITGGIHMDGFLDTCDAMSSWREKEERLRILKDSHVGAFAVISVCMYFVAALGIVSELTLEICPYLAFGFVLARSFSGLSVVTFVHANPKGTAALFGDRSSKKTVISFMIVYLLASFVLMTVLALMSSQVLVSLGCVLVVFAAALGTFFFYRHLSTKYFGGMTGDLAGFFVTVCEILMPACAVIYSLIVRSFV